MLVDDLFKSVYKKKQTNLILLDFSNAFDNVIPMNVKSKVRLFADDTALYLTISTSSKSEIFQKDLDNLERWSHNGTWNLTHLNAFFLSHSHNKVQKPNSYPVYSSQLHT